MLPVWTEVASLAEDPAVRFFEHGPPHSLILWALIADIVVTAAIILAARFGWASRRPLVRFLSMATLVLCTGLALFQISHWFGVLLYQFLPFRIAVLLKIGICGTLLFALFRTPHTAEHRLKALFLILVPVLPMYAFHALWSYRTVTLDAGHGTASFLPIAPHSPHVVWVVFDELDERILFDIRPQRLHLPEFDRLRKESVFAHRALPPGPETLWSMPSFLLGRQISNPKMDTGRLSVQFAAGGPSFDFASQPNVFHEARAGGFNTGLTGWYLPYCRMIGNDLSDCTWAPLGTGVVWAENVLQHEPFYKGMLYLARWDARLTFPLLVTLHFLDVMPDDFLSRQYQSIHAARTVSENAIRMLRDRRLNFIVIHVPAPHPPGIWETRRRQLAFGRADYLDNYELADSILGQIRRTLEETGEWDHTTLLVTSDHPYRPELWKRQQIWSAELEATTAARKYPYVPFFLKLPLQRQAVPYRREFNNVLSGRLLLEALHGNVNTPEQAVTWIGRH